MRTLVIVLISTVLFSCGSKEQVAETQNDWSKEGYFKATVVHDDNKKVPCDYLLKLEDGSVLEPPSLEPQFARGGSEVWIKFTRSRRPSQCEGTPISLEDIKKRGN